MTTLYMNVWRSTFSDHQWTDPLRPYDKNGIRTRDFENAVAADIASRPETGIRRVGILRIKLKEQDDG